MKKYPGVLGRRSRRKMTVEELALHQFKGLDLLCEHYGIREADPTARFMRLALHLAVDHVPYFGSPATGKPGPKSEARLLSLLADVHAAKLAGARSNAEAVRRLIDQPEWSAYDEATLGRILRRAAAMPAGKAILKLLEVVPSESLAEISRLMRTN
jgi:hypothetical protein